jgi:ADP-ribose pyrophosphatase YjhB (NUDIX family)
MQHRQTVITVGAVCYHAGRFLLIEERVRGRLVVNQPSGHREPKESLVEAAVREAREESGHRFLAEAVGGVYFWQNPRNGTPMMRVNFIGSVQSPSGPVTLDEGIERFVWRSRAQLLQHSTPPRNSLVLRTVDDYLAGKRYPLSLLQHIERDWFEDCALAA